MEVYLIRHAQSMANLEYEDKIGGRDGETPLSELGQTQAFNLATYFENNKIYFQGIHSSSAKRTLSTLMPICDATKYFYDDVIISDEIHEISHGEFEKKIRSEVLTKEMLELRDRDPINFKFGKGTESPFDVETRMFNYINSIEVQDRVALFSHSFAISCLLRKIGDLPFESTYKNRLENTSFSRIKLIDGNWHTLSRNETPHLQ